MFKKIGNWFDNLCNKNLSQDSFQDKSAITQFINKQPDLPYKRIVNFGQLKDEIFRCLRNGPNNVVRVERKHNLDTRVEITYHYYIWHEKIKHLIVTPDKEVLYYEIEINSLFTSEHFTHRDILEISVLKYGEDIPKASKVILSKLKLKPYALPHYMDGLYLESIEDDDVNFLTTKRGARIKHSYLFLDTYLLLKDVAEKSSKVYDKYLITDYDKVDRKLIPQTNACRWVIIDEYENGASEWVIRWVPKNIGCGKIRYFGMTFNFDANDLGGTAFEVDQLITDTIGRLVVKLKADLKDNVNGESSDLPANVYFNFNNLMVKHKSITTSLVGYMQRQSKSEFQDSNPYLTRTENSFESNEIALNVRKTLNSVL